MKNIIVASTSTLHQQNYLAYLLDELELLYAGIDDILFIPYARPGGISHDEYTEKASEAFLKINKKLRGIHTFEEPNRALKEAKSVFVGGGNTFVLVSKLYETGVMHTLREKILNGMPYLGTSAGSNICGPSIQTTNDMPIVYPPSFKTLGVIPFNVNPHYLDPIENSEHMGETRETRIKEFHTQNTVPVIGLREGSWLRVHGDSMILKGMPSARIFEQNKTPYEVEAETALENLF